MNPACPAVNETAGAMPATRIATGSSAHSSAWFVPTSSTSAPPMTNPIVVPTSPRTRVLPGAQGVGAEHRQGAEHDPERVLGPAQVRDQDGAGRARSRRGRCCAARPSAARRVRARVPGPRRSARRRPRGCRPSSLRHQVRASAAVAISMFAAIAVTAKRELLGAEARAERGRRARRRSPPSRGGSTSASGDRLHRAARADEVVEVVLQAVLRRLVRATAPCRRGRAGRAAARLDLAHRRVGRPVPDGRGVVEDHAEPDHLVDQPDDRARRRRQTRRAVRRGEERGAQRGDGGVGAGDRRVDVLARPRRAGARPRRSAAPTAGGTPRPRRRAAARCAARATAASPPAATRRRPGASRAAGPGSRRAAAGRGDGEDEAQQDRGARRRERRADHAREEHQEPDDEHRRGRDPRVAARPAWRA